LRWALWRLLHPLRLHLLHSQDVDMRFEGLRPGCRIATLYAKKTMVSELGFRAYRAIRAIRATHVASKKFWAIET